MSDDLDTLVEEHGPVAVALFRALRDRIEGGLLAGAEQSVEYGSGDAQHAVEAYRHVIDLIDAALDKNPIS